MIAIDSLALVAVVFEEAEADDFLKVIARSRSCFISAVSVLEVSMVASRRNGPELWAELDRLLARSGAEIVPFDAEQAQFARAAFLRYGKGHHPARLNMGDCASYALATSRNLPLLFKGDDFARTDVARAA